MVTAIITTYNRSAAIVERALQSVIRQTYSVDEIIIVDDNPDGSELSKPIKELCKIREGIRYIKQDGNKGACAARNLGIKYAHGDFIGFLDDDDIWCPDKIEEQIKAFELGNRNLGMVFCSGIQIDDATGEESDYYNCTSKRHVGFNDLLGYDYIGSTSNPLIRHICFDVVGVFWEQQPARQDYEMWLRISREYEIVGIEGKHFIYTLHTGDQITKNKRKSYEGFRNIYIRYKQNYKKNPRAWVNILICIIRNRTRIDLEVLWYGIVRQFVQIKYKLPRNEW